MVLVIIGILERRELPCKVWVVLDSNKAASVVNYRKFF